jgi:hypothetical protein
MAARYLLPSGAFGHEGKFSEDLIKRNLRIPSESIRQYGISAPKTPLFSSLKKLLVTYAE